MQQGRDVVLHPEELYVIEYSLWTVVNSVLDRIRNLGGRVSILVLAICQFNRFLIAIYGVHNFNQEDKLKKVFFGLVSVLRYRH